MDIDELLNISGAGGVNNRSLYDALLKYLMQSIHNAGGYQYSPSSAAQTDEDYQERMLRNRQRDLEKMLIDRQISMLSSYPPVAQATVYSKLNPTREEYKEKRLRDRQRELEEKLLNNQISMLGSYDFRRQEQDEQEPTFDQWLRWMQIRKREPQEGWMPKFRGGY